MSLRSKLLLTLVPLFVVGLAVAEVATYASLQSFLLSRVDQQLIAAHNAVGEFLTGSSRTETERAEGGAPPFPEGTYGQLRSPTGTVLKEQTFGFGAHAGAHPVLPPGLVPGTRQSPNMRTLPGTGGISRYRVYIDTADDGNGDILLVGIPLDDVDGTLGRLVEFEVAITAAVTLVLALASWLVVRRNLQPLERMGRTARSIVSRGLHQRVKPASDRSEVGRLGLALNEMLEQLEAAFAARAASEERLRQFVSDASHELRTPLTSMRGYAELLRRRPGLSGEEQATAARRIEDEARRLGELVEELLLLARLDEGRELATGRVDLDALVTDACADARVSDPARQIRAVVTAPLVVDGDEPRLRQVLGNLLRNALVHTPPGSPVEVLLKEAEGEAVIEVVDHGPGIPAADRDMIFDRFHRADPGRSRDRGGSGLGLSIAAAVVEAHRGAISVADTPGGGATFRIRLPLDGDTQEPLR